MTAEMDRQQVADALGVSFNTLRAYGADPKCPLGPGEKRGRRLIWPTEEVKAAQAWLAAGKSKPKKKAKASIAEKLEPVVETKKAAAAQTKTTKKAGKKSKAKSAEKQPVKPTLELVKDAPKPKAEKPAKAEREAKRHAHGYPVGVDPIAAWLDACKAAAKLFEQSVDPRRAFLLMNPFAPFAAYASFVAPFMPKGADMRGLGVWGAPSASEPKEPSARKMNGAAGEEARKLFSCVSTLATRH